MTERFRIIVGCAIVSSAITGSAQTSKGILSGVVRDQTNASIADASITLTNQETGETRTLQSQRDGAYRVDAIDAGRYTILVTRSGFAQASVKDVVVSPSQVTSYDLSLAVGGSSTVVQVEANQATIDTENGTLTGVVNAVEINKLPIFSLNPVELAVTVPGVQPVSNANFGGAGAFSNGFNIQVNGSRPRANNFLLDGQEINDVGIGGQAFQPAIPDIFDSVVVITNSASAEYGRAGGGIVNIVTKQGTNQFHGTAFERYTGSGLNSIEGGSRGPFADTGYTKPRSNMHSYGFTAGGPILKDKLFAFGALELQRFYGNAVPKVNLLPDAAGYATLQTITGAPAAQVQLLDSYLSGGAYLNADVRYAPTAGTYTQNVGALPGCPATGCVISFAGFQRPVQAQSSPDTQWMYRIDYRPWERDSFSFRYLHDRASLGPDFGNNGYALAGFDTLQGGPSELGEGSWTHVFTSNLLNEFRVSEARISFAFSPTPSTLANPLNALPTFSFAGLSTTTTGGSVTFPSLGPNQNFPQGRSEDLYQFQDTVGWTKGRQSFRFGADIGRLIEIDLVSQNARGTLGFTAGGSGTSSLGNFLLNQLGPSGTATKVFGKTRADSHGYRDGFFAQDDIKLTSDLTVNLGVRYDFLTNPENSIPYPAVDTNNVFAPINTAVSVKEDYNNVAPRIGFAYSPHGDGFFGDGKTVLRGGFGVFYDSTFSNILVNSVQSAPNVISGLLTQTTGDGLSNATGLLATITPVLSPLAAVNLEASNTVNPLTYQYNLGIERQLPGQIVLGVRYVGNRGEKLFANQQFNYFSNGTRLNLNRGQINTRGNYADSNYNGVEISGVHNFSKGLLISANYTFSKDLDDGSEIFTIGNSSPTSFSANLAPGGRRQEYGPSAYDHRQFFSVAYVYQPAGIRSDNKLTDAALGVLTRHWTISGVSQLQSGGYSTFNVSGFDLNGDGSTTNDRPIVVNRSSSLQSVGTDGFFLPKRLKATPGVYYDQAQLNNGVLAPIDPTQVHFLVPHFPQNEFLSREIGRNSFLTPGITTHNVALEKGIGLSYFHLERGTLLLRAEAQNLANHNDNVIGDLNLRDAGAGFATPARIASNRQLILWAKFQF